MSEISSLTTVQSNHEKYAHLFESAQGNDMVNTETFFNLLMAEMSNQDPLEPMSNTEFVSQMAQFTGLQAQQENLKFSSANYASNLVGKTVTVNAQNEDGSLKTGVCSGVTINGSDVKVTVDSIQYELSQIKAIADTKTEAPKTDVNTATAFIGKEVTVKVMGEDGNYYYDYGLVSSVEVGTDGEAKIIVNDYVYSLDEIVYVQQATASQNTGAQTDTGTDNDRSEQEMLEKILEILES